jgi:hypothetical protein
MCRTPKGTLLRTVNNWQCIFSYPDICGMRNMSPQRSARSTVRAIRAMMPLGMADRRNHADSVQQSFYKPVLSVPLANILAASPYIPPGASCAESPQFAPTPCAEYTAPYQAQCDPVANISVTNEVAILSNTVTLEHPFPISSDDCKSMPMTATIKGTFVLQLSDGTMYKIPMYYYASPTDTIVLPHHFTSPAITDRHFNDCCLIDLPGCCHLLLPRSMSNDAAFIDVYKSKSRDQAAALPVAVSPASPPNLKCYLSFGINASATLVYLPIIPQVVSGIHPTFGLDLHYGTDRHRCQIMKMDPGTPAHHILQWRSRICHAFVISINQAPAHTIADALHAVAKARQLDNKTGVVALTNDDDPNCLSAVGLPQLFSTNFGSRSITFCTPLLQSSTKPSPRQNSTVGICISN